MMGGGIKWKDSMCFGTLWILWSKSYDAVLEKKEHCWWWFTIITYRKLFSHAKACVRIGLNTRPPPMSDGTQAFGPGACGRIVLTTSQSMHHSSTPSIWYTDHVTGGLPREAQLVMSDASSLFLMSRLGRFRRKAQTFTGWPHFKVL
jgi:hypothetical protein